MNIRALSGPGIEKPADLVTTLTNLGERDVLFIDEIHRLRPVIEEFLYPVMEDFKFEMRIGEGPKAAIDRMSVEPFTLLPARPPGSA